MGSSAKKKNAKKKDFEKPKLKVGKTRPKNTNTTDTSFSAKSIIFKQQSLGESGRDRDTAGLFNHNLSLLSSKTDSQRKDALTYLTSACNEADLPQSASAVLAKAQPLILDGSFQVRQQLLRLLRALHSHQLGSLGQLQLYIRAGMAHLSSDIRISSLDVLDWLLEVQGEAVVSSSGGWVKTLRTFQNLLGWNTSENAMGQWSSTKPATNLGSNKLLVHQLTTLARFLTIGLKGPTQQEIEAEHEAAAKRAADLFPLCHTDAHMMSNKSNSFGYLNLFGAPRDVESEIYEDAEERTEVFIDVGLKHSYLKGVKEAKKEAGEVGRAAALVDKALRLADEG